MDSFTPVASLVGGILIGLSATVMLLFHGRVAGVTGIVAGVLDKRTRGDVLWRVLFLAGLVVGGAALGWIRPELFASDVLRSPWAIVAAGLLVGFGTRLGSGCTSGHGVCGVSRLAPRSLIATVSFIASGAATVFVVNHVLGGSV
jgi:uncharacterized membrane protein YedE/YeeE